MAATQISAHALRTQLGSRGDGQVCCLAACLPCLPGCSHRCGANHPAGEGLSDLGALATRVVDRRQEKQAALHDAGTLAADNERLRRWARTHTHACDLFCQSGFTVTRDAPSWPKGLLASCPSSHCWLRGPAWVSGSLLYRLARAGCTSVLHHTCTCTCTCRQLRDVREAHVRLESRARHLQQQLASAAAEVGPGGRPVRHRGSHPLAVQRERVADQEVGGRRSWGLFLPVFF